MIKTPVNEIKTDAPMEIIFVDDEKNVLQALRRLFMDEDDFHIHLANSGEDALEIIQNNNNIGLIVSDQRMPGLTGVDFLEKAKELLPDALRILLTGYADINAVAEAINRGGAYRYITKPWDDEDIIQVIKEASKRYSLQQENRKLQKIVEKQNDELKRWNAQLEYFVQEQTLEIQQKNKVLEEYNVRLKHNFNNTIMAFSNLLELRNKRTGNHSKNVAELSSRLAKSAGMSDAEIETIAVAALLHDIGKIGIPDSLLLQEVEAMDVRARDEYIQHPVRGQASIDSVEDLREAGVLIRHHHECFDGSGFPDRLRGDDIPMGARIICLADFIDRTCSRKEGSENLELKLKSVSGEFGSRFDPGLRDYYEKPVIEIYSAFLPKTNEGEMEIMPDDLRSGMVLSRDLTSGTGLTLLSAGTEMNSRSIASIKRYYELDPSETGIFVMLKG